MNLNKVFLFGNLTRDPELRQTPSGHAVCSFGIATNRTFKDQSGQRQEQSEFHNIVAWGRQAEVIAQYMKKGSSMFIEGRLQTRSWQDQQAIKHWRTEIIIEQFQFGPKPGGGYVAPPRDDMQSSENQLQKSSIAQPQDTTPIIELPQEEDIDINDIPF